MRMIQIGPGNCRQHNCLQAIRSDQPDATGQSRPKLVWDMAVDATGRVMYKLTVVFRLYSRLPPNAYPLPPILPNRP
jgi:hypothetical protein